MAAKLEGGDPATWEKGQARLKALKPNFKAFYANDAASQQLLQTGEAPVQVMLSMNAYYIASQGVKVAVAIPKEGAVLGIDTIGIMKGTKKADLAHKFINIVLDPAVQAEIANLKKGSPVVEQRQARSRGGEAAGCLHHARPVEHGSNDHRPQAARREDRRVAQVVHRERDQLRATSPVVMRGLDPRIHHLRKSDGLPGQAPAMTASAAEGRRADMNARATNPP